MVTWSILVGDVRQRLADLEDGSVQCVVTSPPYWGLRDYGTGSWEGGDPACEHAGRPKPRQDTSGTTKRFAESRGTQPGKRAYAIPVREECRCGARRIDAQIGLESSPDAYVAAMVDVFREVRRVLRDDGTCWINLGDSYVSSGHGRTDEGFNARWHGKHYATNKQGQSDTQRPRRSNVSHGLKPKDLVGIPWRIAFALQADGWYLRSDIIWAKPNPMPESVTDRPAKSHEYVFLLTKAERYYYDHIAVMEAVTGNAHARGHGVNPKAGAVVNQNVRSGLRPRQNPSFSAAVCGLVSQRNLRSVWTITTQPFPEAHFATFPEELPARCIKAGTSEGGACPMCETPLRRITEKGAPLEEQRQACGADADGGYYGQAIKPYAGTGAQNASDVKRRILEGMRERVTVGWERTCDCDGVDGHEPVPCTVLDPFNGAGTTGVAAIGLGRSYIGIELSEAYADMARRRIADVAPLLASEVADPFTDEPQTVATDYEGQPVSAELVGAFEFAAALREKP